MALRRDNHGGPGSGGGKAIADAKVEDAFRTIIKWIGEDPDRDGLIETPDRLGALTANISPATRRTRRRSCARPSARSTATTR